MNDEKEPLQEPAKPMSVFQSVALHGAVGALTGAIFMPLWEKLFGKKEKLVEAAVKGAVNVGMISMVIGYFQGHSEIEKHELNVDRFHLKQRIRELETDKTFAQAVAAEKMEKLSQPPARE